MTLSTRWWAFWGLLLAAPMLFFAAMLASPAKDALWVQPTFHFWVVSGTALAAFVACAAVVAMTESLRETRLLFLGLAFMSIARGIRRARARHAGSPPSLSTPPG